MEEPGGGSVLARAHLDRAAFVAARSATTKPRRPRWGDLAMGYVRAFTREDITEIVALRRRIFSRTERPADADLAAYIEAVFFDNPWHDETLPSLVYADASGRPIGFSGCGAAPRDFSRASASRRGGVHAADGVTPMRAS